MAGKPKAVPEGRHTLTPHLVVREPEKAIEFYKNAFGAQILFVQDTPDGKVMHARLKLGDSQFMLAGEQPGIESCQSPQTLGGASTRLNVYIENVDRVFNQAVAAGATVTMPLANQFWGDRFGQIKDPFGHSWYLGEHVEDVAPEEIERRRKEVFAQMAKGKGQAAYAVESKR